MTEQLRQAALDYLTPLLSENVPFITINQMIEALRHNDFGIVVNKPMIMELLDPDEVEAISKIEGDRIFLATPDTVDQDREVSADDAEKDQAHVQDMAQGQAQQNLEQPPPEAPPQAPPQPAKPKVPPRKS